METEKQKYDKNILNWFRLIKQDTNRIATAIEVMAGIITKEEAQAEIEINKHLEASYSLMEGEENDEQSGTINYLFEMQDICAAERLATLEKNCN